MKRILGCFVFGAALLVAIPSQAVIHETFEGEALGAFDGLANHTWVGDAIDFDIDDQVWPTGPDFAGTRSLRSPNDGVASDLTMVTSLSGTFDPSMTFWSVFVSGNSDAITDTPRDFSLILMSDSSSAAAIEAGTMNGYRLRIGDDPGAGGSTDSLLLEEANGAGWTVLANNALGASVSLTNGWNLAVRRTTGGIFDYGYSNGSLGAPVTLAFSTTDSTVTTAGFTGMNYRSPITGDNSFGFDNFDVIGVPEPSAIALLVLGGLLAWRRRK